MSNPTTGSPTITLFQLHSNCHTGLETQTAVGLNNFLILFNNYLIIFSLFKLEKKLI